MRGLMVVIAAMCGCNASSSAPAERARSAAAPTAPAPDVDTLDGSGWTALQRAAMDGDLPAIEALLARGAAIEHANPDVYGGATALVIALQFGSTDAAKLLLARGASAGTEALALAARDGHDDLVAEFLRRGVPVRGSWALEAAAKYGHADIIRRLVAAGAPVNAANAADHRYTPLMIACMEDQLAAAQALLDLGARTEDRDDDDSTALHWAVFGARPDELHIYAEPGEPHDTVWQRQPAAPVVALLLQRGAAVDPVDGAGNTPLHAAAMFDADVAAQLLLAAGADRTRKNRDGKTARDLAAERKNAVADLFAKPRP